ncbi:hypothetical protein TNCV_2457361 [Trichonephila clavipes]|nr:hypothetical protein TNCV_2457361 [Trichonephila clavipes]
MSGKIAEFVRHAKGVSFGSLRKLEVELALHLLSVLSFPFWCCWSVIDLFNRHLNYERLDVVYFSVPGCPASNGLVERSNKVLKDMIHHVIREDPRSWD